MGLVEEGAETIEEGKDKEPLAADLALITAAQKVEHYEIPVTEPHAGWPGR